MALVNQRGTASFYGRDLSEAAERAFAANREPAQPKEAVLRGWKPNCEHWKDGVCKFTGVRVPRSMCEHCLRDRTGLFRAGLEAAWARRELRRRLDAGGEAQPLSTGATSGRLKRRFFTCHRFGMEVDEEFCRVCRRNPVLRQRLARCRREPCIHRGPQIGTEEISCCGGRTREVPVYRCSRRGEARQDICARCPHYQPVHKREVPPADSCISWPDLWGVHQGETILVLACGPSVYLPGDPPSEAQPLSTGATSRRLPSGPTQPSERLHSQKKRCFEAQPLSAGATPGRLPSGPTRPGESVHNQEKRCFEAAPSGRDG